MNGTSFWWSSYTRSEIEGGVERARERARGGKLILGNSSQQDRQSNLKPLSQRRTQTQKVGWHDNGTVLGFVVKDKWEATLWFDKEFCGPCIVLRNYRLFRSLDGRVWMCAPELLEEFEVMDSCVSVLWIPFIVRTFGMSLLESLWYLVMVRSSCLLEGQRG